MRPEPARKASREPVRTLHSIAVLWRNDHDDGLGLRFTADTTPSAEFVDNYLRAVRGNKPDALRDWMTRRGLTELRKLAKKSKRRALSEVEVRSVVFEVAMLVDQGVIVDGEFDGITYSYVTGRASQDPAATSVHYAPAIPTSAQPERLEGLLAKRLNWEAVAKPRYRAPAPGGVLDDLCSAIARQQVEVQGTDLYRHALREGTTFYEIEGRRGEAELHRQWAALGIMASGLKIDFPAAWLRCRDALPGDNVCIAFSLRDKNGVDLSVVQAIERGTVRDLFETYVTDLDGWVVLQEGYIIRGGELCTYLTRERAEIIGGFPDRADLSVQNIGLAAVIQVLMLLKFQAVEYRMGSVGAGQHRLNAKLTGKRPVLLKPRLIDLSKPKIELIPVVRPSQETGNRSPRAAHDRRGTMRTYRAERYRNVRGTTAPVRPAKIHGGAAEPRVTVVRLPDAQPTRES